MRIELSTESPSPAVHDARVKVMSRLAISIDLPDSAKLPEIKQAVLRIHAASIIAAQTWQEAWGTRE